VPRHCEYRDATRNQRRREPLERVAQARPAELRPVEHDVADDGVDRRAPGCGDQVVAQDIVAVHERLGGRATDERDLGLLPLELRDRSRDHVRRV
jgi:hypothetical protein